MARTGAPLISRLGWLYLGLIAFSIVGGTVTHFLRLETGSIGPVASVATILVGCAACFEPCLRQRPTVVAGVLCLFAVMEYIGIATGFPFGRYAYTDRWWPVVRLAHGIAYPLAVPFAWLLIVGSSFLFASGFLKGWRAVLPGAVLAAVVDLGMEPVMTERLGYWRWIDRGPLPGHAPLSNLAAWFGLALVAGLWLHSRRGILPRDPDSGKTARQDAASTAGLVLVGQVLLMLWLYLL